MGLNALIAFLFGLLMHSTTCSGHRKLLQKSDTDCWHLHKQCISCAAQAGVDGSVVACLACTGPAYRVTEDDRSCECSSGYFPANDDSKTCRACGRGAYCTGANTPRQTCGELLTTLSATASNYSACITLPGVAYMRGASTATKCPVDTYNVGGNQRNCTECPGELVTAGAGAASIESCEAPPGFFYRTRQAIPCAIGTYKPGINKNSVCQSCPEGTSTTSTQSYSSADCKVVLQGYEPIVDATGITVIGATPCPVGTHSTDGQKCIPCAAGLTTEATKSTAVSACVAPPGYGYYPDPLQVPAEFPPGTNASSVIACPTGWFKEGHNLDHCVTCGVGFFTNTNASTSPDACYIPAGWGSKHVYMNTSSTSSGAPVLTVDDASTSGQKQQQQLVATKCGLGNYGAESKVFGQEPMPCQPCPEHTTTPDAFPNVTNNSDVSTLLMTSVQNCSNMAGYGWQHGIAAECPIGFYSPGYNWLPCQECGTGLTTAKPGRTGVQDCIAKPGWQLVAVALAASCPAGTWSAGGTQSQCTPCASGSTTVGPASPSADECSVCLPGWGVPGDRDKGAACVACDYGTYSPGGVSTCVACEARHTSARRSADSTACVPIWSTVDPYSSIPTPESALRQVQTAADAFSCQGACGASADCQFYVFRAAQQNQTQNGCYLKDAAAKPLANTHLAFKLVTNIYTVWGADADTDAQLGNSIPLFFEGLQSAASASQCLDACDASASCLGIWTSYNATENGTWECRLMGGQFRHRESTAIQVNPAHINDATWAQDTEGAGGLQSDSGHNSTAGSSTDTDAASQAGIANSTTAAVNGVNNTNVANNTSAFITDSASDSNTGVSTSASVTAAANGTYDVLGVTESNGTDGTGSDGDATDTSAAVDSSNSDTTGANSPATNTTGNRTGSSGSNGNVTNSSAADGLSSSDTTDAGSAAGNATTSMGADSNSTATAYPCIGYWSTSSPCSAECGGNQSMVFAVFTPASNGGSECAAKAGDVRYVPCNTLSDCPESTAQEPSTTPPPPPTPIDCVGAWFPTSPCSGPCGNGTATVTYLITTAASNNGAECRAADGATQTFSCDPCQGNNTAVSSVGNSNAVNDSNGSGMQSVNVRGWNPAVNSPGHIDTDAWPFNMPAYTDTAESPLGRTDGNSTGMPNTAAFDSPAAVNDTADNTAATNAMVDSAPEAVDVSANNARDALAASPVDAPAANTPLNDTATSNTRASYTADTNTSAADTPTADTPAADTPATNTPAADTPAADTPATNTPVNDTAATNTPAADTPATNTPVNDTAATNTPAADIPATSAPVNDTATNTMQHANTPANETINTVIEPGTNSTAEDIPATSGNGSADAPTVNSAAPNMTATNISATNATETAPNSSSGSPTTATQPRNSTVDGVGTEDLYDTTNSSLNVPATGLNAGVSSAAPYLGCFQDIRCFEEPQQHALPNLLAEDYYSMTVEACAALGQAQGMRYIGVQYYGQCWGGNDTLPLIIPAVCDTNCAGNHTEMCGGACKNAVYEVAY